MSCAFDSENTKYSSRVGVIGWEDSACGPTLDDLISLCLCEGAPQIKCGRGSPHGVPRLCRYDGSEMTSRVHSRGASSSGSREMSVTVIAVIAFATSAVWLILKLRKDETSAILLDFRHHMQLQQALWLAKEQPDSALHYERIAEALLQGAAACEGVKVPATEATLSRIALGECTSPDFLHRHGFSHGTRLQALTGQALRTALSALEKASR